MNPSLYALTLIFLTIIFFHCVNGLPKESKWGLLRIFLLALGGAQLFSFPGPQGSLIACLFGLIALGVDYFEDRQLQARVFLSQNILAYLLLITGFTIILVPNLALGLDVHWISAGFIILGLFMSAGIPPFQSGMQDLYDSPNRWRVLPFVLLPLPWFIAIPVIDIFPPQVLDFMRLMLFIAIVVGSIATLRCDSKMFLCTSRSVLLAWALLFLITSKESSSHSLISLSAYLSPAGGLHAVHRLAETRLGHQLVSIGGLGRHLPGLAAFGLFFSLAMAGLPFTTNYFAAKAVGDFAVNFGVEFVYVSYFAIALLAISAYRHYTLIFMGKSSVPIPAGLDLRWHERLGLLSMSALSPSTSLFLFCME